MNTTHFFLYPDSPNNPLPSGWNLILRHDEQREIIEPTWIKNREVTVNIKDEMSYVIVAAKLGTEQSNRKLYSLIRFGPNVTFYFNTFMAFLEVKSNDSDKALSLAIQFFNKLLRKAYGITNKSSPLILFDN